ncbi:hypothetical protein Tsubulata_020090 [Turnera subulata]|uniref:Uncharacterized protein n=1 Tax=Turnera subulata TaxID=218843 RepID=A0A9Q0FS64_9ROSI|nr:hypothetical protein Tsubulata_020090 [Turnera subulata]
MKHDIRPKEKKTKHMMMKWRSSLCLDVNSNNFLGFWHLASNPQKKTKWEELVESRGETVGDKLSSKA